MDTSDEKKPIVIHLAQIKKDLTAQERREIAEKIAEALLKDRERADQ